MNKKQNYSMEIKKNCLIIYDSTVKELHQQKQTPTEK